MDAVAVIVKVFINIAVTVVSAFIVTLHVPEPAHPPPDQPAKTEDTSGVAVTVTIVPTGYDRVQLG